MYINIWECWQFGLAFFTSIYTIYTIGSKYTFESKVLMLKTYLSRSGKAGFEIKGKRFTNQKLRQLVYCDFLSVATSTNI